METKEVMVILKLAMIVAAEVVVVLYKQVKMAMIQILVHMIMVVKVVMEYQ